MADIELVIKIPEEKYNYVIKQVADGIINPLKICIANGTPLTEIIESIKDKILDNYDNSKGDGVREECLDIIDNAIYGGRHYICEDYAVDKGEQE